ncbi:MAG: PTS sugar transporter subunit IIB [Liquorilactobacillus ghanensis]|uniref:PTS sugar transporter subunit IIB n=1 Tax=Liquorilactobacillus ghanensis TaxID=399370 RepID=UPI0039E9927E
MTKNIMLVCSAGMSTSLLVTKMEKAALDKSIAVEIFATAAAEADSVQKEKSPDIIMLGPQVRYMLDEFKKKYSVPVVVIDMRSYGMMDGGKVLTQALNIIED